MDIKLLSEEVIKTIKSFIDGKLEIYNLKMAIFEERIKTIKDGRDGRDGNDGVNGKDATQIDIIDGIDLEKSYPKGTYAAFKNGLFLSEKTTNGEDGWKCLVNGIEDIEIDMSEDMRSVKIKTITSSGAIKEKSFNIPSIIYKGVFSADQSYEKGDCVTYGGSTWISKSNNNKDKPSESVDWQLSVKRGRDK